MKIRNWTIPEGAERVHAVKHNGETFFFFYKVDNFRAMQYQGENWVALSMGLQLYYATGINIKDLQAISPEIFSEYENYNPFVE